VITVGQEEHGARHPRIFVDLFAAANCEHSGLDTSHGIVIGGHGWDLVYRVLKGYLIFSFDLIIFSSIVNLGISSKLSGTFPQCT